MGEGKWKIGFFVVLAILLVAGNILAWFFFMKPKTLPITTPTATPTVQENLPSPTPTPADETTLIKEAVFLFTGLDANKAEVTINQNLGKHAKGNIKEFEAVGGAYWLAARIGGEWLGVYAGQSQPKCSQVDPYEFPVSLVPECLNEAGKVVKR